MINLFEVNETNKMIEQENLDVRTITLGISLLDCITDDVEKTCSKIVEKVCRKAERLVKTGEDISTEYGIPIVNKRISVTPIALVGGASVRHPEEFVPFAEALETCAQKTGVNVN